MSHATCHLCGFVGRVVDVDAFVDALKVDGESKDMVRSYGYGPKAQPACWDGNACMDRRHKLREEAAT